MDDIRYVERTNGRVCIEKVYGHKALSLLYGTSPISRIFAFLFLPLLARVPFFSALYGWLQKRRRSRKKIEPFVRAYQVDVDEFLEPLSSFLSFNDFFIRKLKPQARPIHQDPSIAVLPADGRYLVFPKVRECDGFYVKGQEFNLISLLKEEGWARRYFDGAMAIVRLCPTDYHRFHFPVSGIVTPIHDIAGTLYSVNPIALSKRLSILWENKRVVTEIDSKEFGTVSMIEVGATCVGTIHQTYQPNRSVQKGEEKGYFSFGGSCIILLFEPNRIAFQDDLVKNSARYLETRGLFGTPLGQRV